MTNGDDGGHDHDQWTQVILSSHWSIHLILASHWLILSALLGDHGRPEHGPAQQLAGDLHQDRQGDGEPGSVKLKPKSKYII